MRNKPIHEIPIHLRAKEGLGYLPQSRSLFNLSTYDNLLGLVQLHIKDKKKQKNLKVPHLKSADSFFSFPSTFILLYSDICSADSPGY